MDIRATAKIKINATKEIIKTIKIYKRGLQLCVNTAWNKGINNNIKLHPFVYRKLRKIGLTSQLSISCIKQACGIVKKAKTKPIINNVSIRYNFPRSASMKNNVLSISTIKGRIKIPFIIPNCYKEYFSWNIKESLLRIDNKSRCFFLFTFAKDVDFISSNIHKRVLGIDVGINNLAVTSNRRFYGKNIKRLRIKYDRLISELQAKCTKSAKRKLRIISGRWKRFMAFTNHNISRSIINSVKEGTTIVMEDITNIRKTAKYNKWVHKWSFRQLQNFIEYKAIMKGCRIVYVNPAYTSKECSVCHNDITTRHSGFFQCNVCFHSLNSDLNASYNIAERYTRNLGFGDVTHRNVLCDDSQAFNLGTADEHKDNQHKSVKPLALACG